MSDAKLITFWSAPGSVGKSTLAAAAAGELAHAGNAVLLVDADTYSPSLAMQLGLTDHPAGLAAACRLVAQQRLDAAELQRLSAEILGGSGSLRLLTGLSNATRWPEVTAEILDELLVIAGQSFDYLLLDVASHHESDIHASYSPVGRNSVTRWALQYSDQIVAVAGADPVSISRFLEAFVSLGQLNPRGEVLCVVNRMRNSALGLSAKQQISQTLSRLANVQVSVFIPDDQAAADAALRGGYSLDQAKRSAQSRQALSLFVKSALLGQVSQLDKRVAKLG
ncbi:MAG: hypothetical protein RL100_161 [Actinomycetota bacterium]|jgi:MinD-like ATPase involved in chromosome partitioning or flagellar assembly